MIRFPAVARVSACAGEFGDLDRCTESAQIAHSSQSRCWSLSRYGALLQSHSDLQCARTQVAAEYQLLCNVAVRQLTGSLRPTKREPSCTLDGQTS